MTDLADGNWKAVRVAHSPGTHGRHCEKCRYFRYNGFGEPKCGKRNGKILNRKRGQRSPEWCPLGERKT